MARLDDGLASTTLGDWLPPGGAQPPEDTRLAATAFLYRGLTTMAQVAEVLAGRKEPRVAFYDLMLRPQRSEAG